MACRGSMRWWLRAHVPKLALAVVLTGSPALAGVAIASQPATPSGHVMTIAIGMSVEDES